MFTKSISDILQHNLNARIVPLVCLIRSSSGYNNGNRHASALFLDISDYSRSMFPRDDVQRFTGKLSGKNK